MWVYTCAAVNACKSEDSQNFGLVVSTFTHLVIVLLQYKKLGSLLSCWTVFSRDGKDN